MTIEQAVHNEYFLPYQIDWLDDDSPVKIWEKSRRIGATYVQSYEDVRDCILHKVPSVWFSSADESAAKEYILYCIQWAKIFDIAAEDLGEVVIDSDKDIKALVIQFANGTRIHALSSNPSAFRSKGGKVVWDEAAHHKDQLAMWKAAKPTATWGFPIRILSTHNGNCLFSMFVEAVNKGKLKWSLHRTDIHTAVDQGLYDKIKGRPTTEEEREEWKEELRRDCFDEQVWLEEYCVIVQDGANSILNYDLITRCEEDNILWHQDIIPTEWDGKDKELGVIEAPQDKSSRWVHDKIKDLRQWLNSLQILGNLFIGYDIARKGHLSCIWITEQLYNRRTTRMVLILKNMPFWVQKRLLWVFLGYKKMSRTCIDETGLGMNLAEDSIYKFGKARVEGINFATGGIKLEMAFNLVKVMEDRTLLIPSDTKIRDDLHSVKKITTLTGNVRLASNSNETDGHADRFWALGLAEHAAGNGVSGLPKSASRKRKSKHKRLLEKYAA